MRYLSAIAFLFCSSAFGAFTEYYVEHDGVEVWGTNSIGNPSSLATAFANAADGDFVHVKSTGVYSLGATTVTNPGTAFQFVIFSGYNDTPGDLDNQAPTVYRNSIGGPLITTGFPQITLTGMLTPSKFSAFQFLSFTGSLASGLMDSLAVDDVMIIYCRMENTANNASAGALQLDNSINLIQSDFICSGAVHKNVVQADIDLFLVGCRIEAQADVYLVRAQGIDATLCTFIGNDTGVAMYSESTMRLRAVYCTATKVRLVAERATTTPSVTPVIRCFIGNQATENTQWLENLYVGGDIAVIEVGNRTHSTTPRSGIGDGVLLGEIATAPSGTGADYENVGAGDFRLDSAAPGTGKGPIYYSDMGAYPNAPSAGGGGSTFTPTMRRSGN